MTPIDKIKFIDTYNNRKYKKAKLIYSCYKDLFDKNESNSRIIEFIRIDVGVLVTHKQLWHYKKLNINPVYLPDWRDPSPTLQKGIEPVIPQPKPNVKFVQQSPVTTNQSLTSSEINDKLPDDYVRKPHNFVEKRYHESLKNYTFDYPWHELDKDGIPRPAQVGKTHNDRLQWLLDIDKYEAIKESYIMPQELIEFKSKHPSVFQGYTKDGFPHSFGGFHPNIEIFNKLY